MAARARGSHPARGRGASTGSDTAVLQSVSSPQSAPALQNDGNQLFGLWEDRDQNGAWRLLQARGQDGPPLLLGGPSPCSPCSHEASVTVRVHYGCTRHGVTERGPEDPPPGPQVLRPLPVAALTTVRVLSLPSTIAPFPAGPQADRAATATVRPTSPSPGVPPSCRLRSTNLGEPSGTAGAGAPLPRLVPEASLLPGGDTPMRWPLASRVHQLLEDGARPVPQLRLRESLLPPCLTGCLSVVGLAAEGALGLSGPSREVAPRARMGFG